MEKLTYRQAYDKIIEAYFKDEIQPFHPCFCFCGTLNNGSHDWIDDQICSTGYTGFQLLAMEKALFIPLQSCGLILIDFAIGNCNKIENWYDLDDHPNYEAALFTGMSAALDVLKEIHRSRGENVDEDIPAFTKRELVKAL